MNKLNQYGTLDGNPQIRNINRADQKIINSFAEAVKKEPNLKNEVNNNLIFKVMDAAVHEGHTRNFFEKISAFTTLNKADICEDAVESLIDSKQIKPNLEALATRGCVNTVYRYDAEKIMNNYQNDRKDIIEKHYPDIKVGVYR